MVKVSQAFQDIQHQLKLSLSFLLKEFNSIRDLCPHPADSITGFSHLGFGFSCFKLTLRIIVLFGAQKWKLLPNLCANQNNKVIVPFFDRILTLMLQLVCRGL